MSGSYPNPFFTDPNIARGFGILARTFLPDPEGEAGRQARLGQARLSNTQADREQARLDAGQAASARMRTGQVDPGTMAQVFADILSGADPQTMQALPGFVRGYGASAGASPDRLAELFVGAGGAYENTQPGFDRTDTTRRRGQDVSAGATLGAARIGANATLEGVRLREAGNDRRHSIVARPGDTITAPENSPVAPAGQQGPLTLRGDPRPLTRDAAIASLVPEFLNPPADEDPGVAQRRRELVAPSAAVADIRNQGRPAPVVPTGAARQIEQVFANAITGADGNSYAFDGEAQRWLAARAAEIWQSGGDGVRGNTMGAVNQAIDEFLRLSPPRADSSLNPLSARRYSLPPSLRDGAPPSPAPPTGAPAPAQGGYRNPVSGQTIPEGATVRQNGRNYIIRNGQPVPAS
jgi:hypothetical protein